MPVIQPPTGNTQAPQQYRQPSRKGKKAWRKNVNVSEVEAGLQELNEQSIQGYGLYSEKDAKDLFAVDTTGDTSLGKRHHKHVKKGLKADDIIAARSAIPAVSQRKRPGDKTTDGIIPTKRQRTNYVTHKELVRLRKVADGNHDQSIAVADADHDLWGESSGQMRPASREGSPFSFLPQAQPKKAPKSLSQKPISLAVNGKNIPAVTKPAGGYSYNPLFTDYEERYNEEGRKAVEAEQKRLDAEEADQQKRAAAAKSGAEAAAAEARADLSEWEEDSAWEGIDTDTEEVSVKRPERKTQAQRNKIKRRKEEERRAKHEAATKRKEAQAQEIKRIARAVEEKERALALTKAVGETDGKSDGNDVELRRRQLGKYRLSDRDLELVLPDELQDSLRRLKPEGNLLKDRYRNMLVNGKMESRRRITFRRKPKTTLTEKWTHKDFHLL